MGAAEGSKRLVLDLINLWKIKKNANPALILKKLTDIYNVLEDVYSVEGAEELQSAIDQIGTGAGTIFIEAGTHVITTPIDIDGCGSLVIYGHGDNTILLPADGITVFNITCCASLIIKTLAIDITNYTGATQAVIVNEVNDNIVGFEDVTIGSLAAGFGICIELQSNNCYVDKCMLINAQQGIFINASENHIINNNVIGLHAQYGIHLDTGDQNTISGNTFVDNTIHGMYIHDSDYVIISHNGCFDNLQSGIYLDQASYNTISACICNTNFQNGIYIGNQSNYNTISANNCNNNDSNTANPQGGIVIADDSDFNTISANSCNNNNNAGAGDGYGIIIHAATCNESMVAANNANGNDIDFQDSGTDTTIEYFVQDEEELQDAIDSIGSKSGIVNIEGSFTISATIGIDNAAVHGGSYIIRGDGSNTTLTPSGNFSCFTVREARSVIFENFAISAVNLVGTTPAIYILENSDNGIFTNNIIITGDGTNGYGIQIDSPNCRIENCNITSMLNGIVPTDEHCIITGNICNSNNNIGIFLNTANYITVQSNICRLNKYGIYLTSADENLILGNTIEANTADGIYLNTSDRNTFEGNIIDGNITTNAATDHAGITLNNGALNNFIIGNTIINNANGGAGEGYGVYIINAACVENIVKSNNLSGNDIKWKDVGINSDFEYRCSTNADIQDAIDSIAGKSGIIHILSIAGGIQLTVTIDVDGGGDYIIEGEGEGCVIDCAGDRTAFNITSAKSCVLKDFKIDANDLTTDTKEIINITEISDNPIFIEKIHITGDGTNGRGIELNSDNCNIKDCIIDNVNIGIYILSDYNIIDTCYCNDNDTYGIKLDTASYNTINGNICNDNDIDPVACGIYADDSHFNTINGNVCNSNGSKSIYIVNSNNNAITANTCSDNSTGGIYLTVADNNAIMANICNNNTTGGIYLNQASYNTISGNTCNDNDSNDGNPYGGILLVTWSEYNIIIGNTCANNNNAGAGTTYGIYIENGTCNNNIVNGNQLIGNDTAYLDNGTGTVLFGDDTVYGAGWNGDLGTATKNAIYDKIQLVIAGAAPNAFSIITGIVADVVADNNADTLTFAAAGGLTIVGTALTDTITFTNTITQYTDAMAAAKIALDDLYLKIAGDAMGGDLNMNSNDIWNCKIIAVQTEIQHDGDTSNSINFGVATQTYQIGGVTKLDISATGVRIGAADARITEFDSGVLANSATKVPTSSGVFAAIAASVGNYLPLAGGTMGGAITMGDNLINTALSVGISDGDGNGLRFWNGSAIYSIYMSDQADATYGGRADATSDYNMYFTMQGGTNRGFQFCDGLLNPFVAIVPDTGIWSEVDILIRDAKSLYVYSAGNDKNIRIYHNDTNAYITCTGDLYLSPTGNEVFINYCSVAAEIRHTGDTNNSIAFAADTQTYETGGVTRMILNNSGMRLGADAYVTEFDSGVLANSATKVPTSSAVFAAIAAIGSLSGTTQYMQLEAYETVDATIIQGYIRMAPATPVFFTFNANNTKIDTSQNIIFHMQYKTNLTDAAYKITLSVRAIANGENPNTNNIENATPMTDSVTNGLQAEWDYTIVAAGVADNDMVYIYIVNGESTAYMYIETAWIEYTHV